MSSTVIRVPRITGLPSIIAGLISIRSVVIGIPLTHHSAPARVAQSHLATSSKPQGTPRLSPASKSGLYERAKRRMAHLFKKQTRKGGAPSVVKLRVFHPPAVYFFNCAAGAGSLVGGTMFLSRMYVTRL